MSQQQHSDPLGPEGSYFEAKARKDEDRAIRQLSGAYPIFIVVTYLILGFVFHLWHPGWLVFMTIPIFYMHPKTTREWLTNPVAITLAYLVLGFFFHLWHPGWVLFLAIPLFAVWNPFES